MRHASTLSSLLTLLILAALGQLPGIAAASAQDTPQAPSQAQTIPAEIDLDRFLREAAAGGLAEVELGQLAMRQGHSEAVRGFGSKMVDDHRRANAEIRELAVSHAVELPHTLDAEKTQDLHRLRELDGAAFDEAYMRQMVEDHRETIMLYERAQRSSHADVRAFAERTLPTLREHLTHAERLDQKSGSRAAQ